MTGLGLPMHGDEWQVWANQLLTEHYGPTNYVKVPDTSGDGGLEGFTRKEGHAYQAYGAEPGKTVKQLYQAQRDKMTTDITKFINNKKLLAKMLGPTSITCWALIVPITSQKELIGHTNKMTKEVRDAALPYADQSFYVTVCDEDHFATERDKLLSYKSQSICISLDSPDNQAIIEWMDGNPGLLQSLDEKLTRLSTVALPKQREKFRRDVLIWHIQGQNLLDKIRHFSNTSYEQILQIKGQYEHLLASIQMETTESARIFKETRLDFQQTLSDEVEALSQLNVKSLALEAVADWMLRCPLDFPEGELDG